MEIAARARVGRRVIDDRLRFGEKTLELRVVGRRCVLGGEFGRKRFACALRVHDLGRAYAGEVELHGERLGEQARVAARDARAAAFAHADVRDAERLQRTQRITRHDAAHAETRREVLLCTEEIAGLELFCEQRIAHLGHDLGGERCRMATDENRRGVAAMRFWLAEDRGVNGHPAGPVKVVKMISYRNAASTAIFAWVWNELGGGSSTQLMEIPPLWHDFGGLRGDFGGEARPLFECLNQRISGTRMAVAS